MRRAGYIRSFAAWAALLVLGCGGGGGDSSPGSGPPPFTPPPTPAAGTLGDGRLDELIEWARATQNVPALGAIVIRHGQIAERGVAGLRSVDSNVRVTVDDQWHLGSITKSMTATLAAMLVEDGLITWDTTPLEVWPELESSIDPAFRAVTLRQLLSHTSGMRRDDDWPGAADDATGTTMEKRRAWAARLLSQSPDVPLGVWSYSNMGYIVAGAMLETRAQTQWETMLSTRLFAPLGMTHSGFGAPGTSGLIDQPLGHNTFPTYFNAIPPGPNSDFPRAFGPAGTVHVTMNDFAAFLQAHLAGERGTPGILTTESFRTLHTVVASYYALGWQQAAPLAVLGATTYGHNGTNLRWFAVAWFAPELDVGVLIVTNCGPDRGQEAVSSLDLKLRERIVASP